MPISLYSGHVTCEEKQVFYRSLYFRFYYIFCLIKSPWTSVLYILKKLTYTTTRLTIVAHYAKAILVPLGAILPTVSVRLNFLKTRARWASSLPFHLFNIYLKTKKGSTLTQDEYQIFFPDVLTYLRNLVHIKLLSTNLPHHFTVALQRRS